ncbi:putative beta-1,3-glucan-binding protein precursor [Byssothecium circinans]|uniref:Putative beta-1,3-glucan-binding protein n=1 Tax=Byssothecium circinans TaxID=147558 RepID=A0A6A5TUF3_9PLEO|nr:putative beta-1,3-glucan-binding protein precursor [Byssothecium circinans]
MPPSPYTSSFRSVGQRKPNHEFKSYRLRGEYVQPWVDDKRLKRTKYGNVIVYGCIFIALCLSGYLTYDGAKTAATGDFCMIMEDHFDQNGIDESHWSHEVQIAGYGTGSFDWTTTDKKNSFKDGEGLHIFPTLTTESTEISEAQLFNDYTLNLTKSGGDSSCTSDDYKQCSIKSNATIGTVIPPVRSARMSTKGKKSIKYGRIEVVAKMPRGDWLWPAIWMMPEDSKYGAWPASGEIDIAEFRGNDYHYPLGRDALTSTLHWGPITKLDAYWSTYVFYMKFDDKRTMWEKGNFGGATVNGSVVENPWKATGRGNTPFDERFYLILNVAVGAQNGWFFDGKFNKPWVDNGPAAARDFIKAKDQWVPTWGEGNDRGMTVKSVKMRREGLC